MSLLLATQPAVDHRDPAAAHPEGPERVQSALAGLADAGLSEATTPLTARQPTRSELTAVHTPGYVDALKEFCAVGGGMLDPDTYAGQRSCDAALAAVGAGLSAVDTLRAGHGAAALVLVRPPGHHARPDQAMGFCLLNNIAVCARVLADGGERVMIVDWDVHHGNGTQEVFWNDPNVLYTSIHQADLYPGTGHIWERGGEDAPGMTINLPLPPGATGDVVLAAADDVLALAAERFAPSWVLVSAGFDAHRADPLADLALSAADFADLAMRVKDFSPSPGRLIVFLEGGYDLAALGRSVGAVAATLVGESWRPERATSGGPGRRVVDLVQSQLIEEEWMS